MNKIRRFRKNRKEAEHKLKKVKSGALKLSLIMLNFIFATFAWFTYTKILNPAVDVNVSAWQVDFKDGEESLGNTMQFQVDNFYPGMTDYTKTIQIQNLGDRPASITYEIQKENDIEQIKILGQVYQIKETPSEGDSQYTLYKSETTDPTTGMQVIKILNNSSKFPFEIIITHSQEIDIEDPYDENANKGSFEIRFTWPYEITEIPEDLPDDLEERITSENLTNEQILEELNKRKNALDTQWGYDIATFYQEEGDTTKGIEVTLQAIVKQII